MVSRERITLVVPGDDPLQIQGSPHLERLKPYGDVVLYNARPVSMEEQLERTRNADVILNSRAAVRWPAEALRALRKLRMITTCGVGTDTIDLKVASELGIVVSNQPRATTGAVAEHTIALMFTAAKRAAYMTAQLKAGRWARKGTNVFLQGKTLGIICLGNIGGEVARLANALGMNVIAWEKFDPSPERAANFGVRYVELDDLLRQSDVVSLHARLTDETRGMIGKREFDLMKPGALFVNAARGGLVDMAALVDALNSGHLEGAALDVYDVEPLPADHPVLSCEQVVLTPHMGDQTAESMESLNEGAVDNIIAFLEGRPQNVVT